MRTLGAKEISEGPLAIFFREQGSPPRHYTLRPSFDLRPDLPVRETARRIIHRMLAIARENETGIKEDIDTEFLHDYRISMRKIRSVLSLLKGIYPEEKTNELKALFARYCDATNKLRDLDVYLLAREQYTQMLPEALQSSLAGSLSRLWKGKAPCAQEGCSRSELNRLPRQHRESGAVFLGAGRYSRDRRLRVEPPARSSPGESTNATSESSRSNVAWEATRPTKSCTRCASTAKNCVT